MRNILSLPVLALAAISLVACAEKPSSSETPTPAPEHGNPGTDKAQAKQESADKLQALPQKKFGEAISATANTPLNDLVKDPSKFASQTVRTEGKVAAVCQEMGCWMELSDEAGNAHIKMAGHSFFIPKQAHGHRAVVQGKVMNAAPTPAGGEHSDCAGEAQAATGKVAKLEIEATGVEFVD